MANSDPQQHPETLEEIAIRMAGLERPIAALEETTEGWVLGRVLVRKDSQAWTHEDDPGGVTFLKPGAHLVKQGFDDRENRRRGWAVFLRQPNADLDAVDAFAAWVRSEQQDDLDQWIARLNEEIQKRLKGEPSRPYLVKIGWLHEWTPDDWHRFGTRPRYPTRHKECVLRYLRAGRQYTSSSEVLPDRLDPLRIAGTRSLLTDGKYVWPDYLAYYVERYDVGMSYMFHRYMETNNYQPPSGGDVTHLRLET